MVIAVRKVSVAALGSQALLRVARSTPFLTSVREDACARKVEREKTHAQEKQSASIRMRKKKAKHNTLSLKKKKTYCNTVAALDENSVIVWLLIAGLTEFRSVCHFTFE